MEFIILRPKFAFRSKIILELDKLNLLTPETVIAIAATATTTAIIAAAATTIATVAINTTTITTVATATNIK